ncbi:MAG: 50S ribosome-binding GTPase, partial [Candidatus Saccharimonas sp.]|nr:50S ribosome-binding GTPase [Planctomycetaceae bacterium]
GQLSWLSWAMPVCWGLAWLLLRKARRIEVPLPPFGSRIHWTPHDKAAAEIVAAEQKRIGDEATAEQLTDHTFFRDRTLDLATKVARHYHPRVANPLDALSVVEVLAVVRLVSEDMEEWFDKNIPGSHLVSIGQWRMLAKVPGWWTVASNAGWIASVVMNPFAGLARYALSRAFVDPVTKQVQDNVFGAFFMLYLRQVGFYLIELNSGRLRGGSARYRQAMGRLKGGPREASHSESGGDDVAAKSEAVTVTIAIVGQVKAGKSSLANCLLGEQKAAVDVLPLTHDVTRYELGLDETNDRLVLLDTPGYSDAGATKAELAATREAVRQADLILLVMAATSPAKQADAMLLAEMNGWFREQHRLKPPSVVGVVSKIDGLSPLMEWSPPYRWEQPSRPKEQAIREAVEYARQAVGEGLASVVPVCTDRERGRVFGIEEWLLPTISLQLDEARACSLVRSLHHDHDRLKAWQVFSQLVASGRRIKEAVEALRDPRITTN